MHQPLALAVQPRRQSCGEICRHATMHVACWCMHLGLHTQPITRHRRFKALINWPSIYMSNNTANFHILINHIAARQQQGASTRRTVLQGTKQSGHHVATDLFTLTTACLGQGQVHEQGTTALQGRHRDCIQMTELTHQPPDHTLFHHDGAYLVPATMQFC